MHTTPKYTAQLRWPGLARSSPVNFLGLPRKSHWRHWQRQRAQNTTKDAPLLVHSLLSQLRHKADKQVKAAQECYKQPRNNQVEVTAFWVNFLLLTANRCRHPQRKRAVKAHFEPLSQTLGACCVISTTSDAMKMYENKIPSTISSDCASLTPNSMQPQADTVDNEQQTPKKKPTEVIDELWKFFDEVSLPKEYAFNHIVSHFSNSR